eukprot:6475564-Alexandrium_andersonii.AAC.1
MLHTLSVYASGCATGIVMASGDIVLHAVPIHEAPEPSDARLRARKTHILLHTCSVYASGRAKGI